MVNHGDAVEPVAEAPLPAGWEGNNLNLFSEIFDSFFC